jgi:hypothetical protein
MIKVHKISTFPLLVAARSKEAALAEIYAEVEQLNIPFGTKVNAYEDCETKDILLIWEDKTI